MQNIRARKSELEKEMELSRKRVRNTRQRKSDTENERYKAANKERMKTVRGKMMFQ